MTAIAKLTAKSGQRHILVKASGDLYQIFEFNGHAVRYQSWHSEPAVKCCG